MGYFGERGGIFPRPIEVISASTRVTDLPRVDFQSEKLRSQALTSNHSSRDRGLQLKIGTSRTRNGNSHRR